MSRSAGAIRASSTASAIWSRMPSILPRNRSAVEWGWDASRVSIRIIDDGPGFSADILDRIGEPYATSRSRSRAMAAAVWVSDCFIAKTLLERSGAELTIRNRKGGQIGADIHVEWPRN